MTTKNLETGLNAPDKELDSRDMASNPDNSKAARDISNELFNDVMDLRKDLEEPSKLELVQGNPKYTLINSQLNTLVQVINDPNIRDPKTGNISKEGMKQVQSVYNNLKESYNVLHGIINGSTGKSDSDKLNQTQNDQEKEKEKGDEFIKSLKERLSNDLLEKSKIDAKNASQVNREGNSETGNLNPDIARYANLELQGGYQRV